MIYDTLCIFLSPIVLCRIIDNIKITFCILKLEISDFRMCGTVAVKKKAFAGKM